MNAKATKTPEQKAKDAERARARRAAKKEAAKSVALSVLKGEQNGEPAPDILDDANWQSVIIEGKTYQVGASLNPAEAEKVARQLHSAIANKSEAAPDVERVAEQDAPKPATKRAARVEIVERKDGGARVYLQSSQFDALSGDAAWHKANTRVWKLVKAATRHEQKNGHVYYSLLMPKSEDAALVAAFFTT